MDGNFKSLVAYSGYMSSSDIERLLDETMKDPALAHRFRADPGSVLDEYDLTEEEREALVEGDQNGIRYLLKGEEDSLQAEWRQAISVIREE